VSPLAVVLIVFGCGVAAYLIASAIVAVMDLFGLCWSVTGEERHHAGEPKPVFGERYRR